MNNTRSASIKGRWPLTLRYMLLFLQCCLAFLRHSQLGVLSKSSMQCTRGNNAYCFTLRQKKKKKHTINNCKRTECHNSIQVVAPTSESHMCKVGQEAGKRNDFELKARQLSQPSLFPIFVCFPLMMYTLAIFYNIPRVSTA